MEFDKALELLGVEKNYSLEEIKKAFRVKAFEYHPDRNKEMGSEEKFKEINEAYNILKENKTTYKNKSFSSPFNVGQFRDIFAFWNSFSKQKKSVNKIVIPLKETLKDFIGVVPVKIPIKCDKCKGRGILDKQKINNFCPQCLASGFYSKIIEIKVKIPAGVKHKDKLNVDISDIGSIVLDIIVPKDQKFKRLDDDVLTELNIDFIDAIFGKKANIETLTDKIIKMQVNPGTQHDNVYRIKGLGFPNKGRDGKVGDMRVIIKVKIPNISELSIKQKRYLEKYRNLG